MDPLITEDARKPKVETSSSLYPDLRAQDKEGILEKTPYFQFEEDESSSAILFNSGCAS